MNNVEPYGSELILDLHGCDVSTFTRQSLKAYFIRLCEAIDMERADLHFWDDEGVPPEEQQTSPHTKGVSAVQFILTSSIVIHTLELLEAAYVNIFSCKAFDRDVAEKLTKEWFGAKDCRATFLERI
jgi:S-adenosylmethionine/arginine decarboxylase-like enzyme